MPDDTGTDSTVRHLENVASELTGPHCDVVLSAPPWGVFNRKIDPAPGQADERLSLYVTNITFGTQPCFQFMQPQVNHKVGGGTDVGLLFNTMDNNTDTAHVANKALESGNKTTLKSSSSGPYRGKITDPRKVGQKRSDPMSAKCRRLKLSRQQMLSIKRVSGMQPSMGGANRLALSGDVESNPGPGHSKPERKVEYGKNGKPKTYAKAAEKGAKKEIKQRGSSSRGSKQAAAVNTSLAESVAKLEGSSDAFSEALAELAGEEDASLAKSVPTCYNCNEVGHKKFQCKKPKTEWKPASSCAPPSSQDGNDPEPKMPEKKTRKEEIVELDDGHFAGAKYLGRTYWIRPEMRKPSVFGPILAALGATYHALSQFVSITNKINEAVLLANRNLPKKIEIGIETPELTMTSAESVAARVESVYRDRPHHWLTRWMWAKKPVVHTPLAPPTMRWMESMAEEVDNVPNTTVFEYGVDGVGSGKFEIPAAVLNNPVVVDAHWKRFQLRIPQVKWGSRIVIPNIPFVSWGGVAFTLLATATMYTSWKMIHRLIWSSGHVKIHLARPGDPVHYGFYSDKIYRFLRWLESCKIRLPGPSSDPGDYTEDLAVLYANAAGKTHKYLNPVCDVAKLLADKWPKVKRRAQDITDLDMRPDLLKLSALRHANSQVVDCTISDYRYNPVRWILDCPYSVKAVVSLELLTQTLSAATVSMNTDSSTITLRINQVMRSLHTVNDNRADVLNEQFVRANTALIAQYLFESERRRLMELPGF